jgi:hypothetical protein
VLRSRGSRSVWVAASKQRRICRGRLSSSDKAISARQRAGTVQSRAVRTTGLSNMFDRQNVDRLIDRGDRGFVVSKPKRGDQVIDDCKLHDPAGHGFRARFRLTGERVEINIDMGQKECS